MCSYRTKYLTDCMNVMSSESIEESRVIVKKFLIFSKVTFKRQTYLLKTK